MKRGVSVWVALGLCGLALLFRLLFPDHAQRVRAVFWQDDLQERVVAVFSPNG